MHQKVLDFKNAVLEDPLLRINFNDNILKKQKRHPNGKTLLGDTVEEAFDLINRAVSTPPSFAHRGDISAVPVYALFMDYL
jgi:hypothetical protein